MPSNSMVAPPQAVGTPTPPVGTISSREEVRGRSTGSTVAAGSDGESVTTDVDRSDAELTDHNSDGEASQVEPSESGKSGTEDSWGAECGRSEKLLAQVPPSMPLPAARYPDQNLPPRTGIAVPMLAQPQQFIRTTPSGPEFLYNSPETLFDDIVCMEADRISHPELVLNRIVYDSAGYPSAGGGSGQPWPAADPMVGLADKLPTYYELSGPEDTTLIFESRFESGNLRRAIQAYSFEYDLCLNPDYNTKNHTQWYFFRVGNTRSGPEYRFNIINMAKPTSVYNDGMRPLQYSSVEATESGVGWVRCGTNIAYYQNGIGGKEKGGTNYYTLTFTVTFKHDNDSVYFAHCYPYTYTDLQNDLMEIEKDPHAGGHFRRRKLCDTLAGNACDLLTITSFADDPVAVKSRRAVLITARVHPGESNASWIMKGMLDFLTGSSLDAKILRDNFVFKIIPMLNPDGVIVGNYRCSLSGHDLNRQWGEPSRSLHPTVYFAKSMFRQLINDREVVLYIDLHGHSRKKNVFMYGSSEASGVREKVFPWLLCKSSECFCFDDCCFRVQKSKETTARVVAYQELAVINSFTLEASFCGADFGALADQHFTTRHLEEIGYMVCDAVLDFCDPDQSKVNGICKELQLLYPDDGNPDDVSDSGVDEAAAARARRRRRQKTKKERAKTKTTKDAGKANRALTEHEAIDGVHDAVGGPAASTRRCRHSREKHANKATLDAEQRMVASGNIPCSHSDQMRSTQTGESHARPKRRRCRKKQGGSAATPSIGRSGTGGGGAASAPSSGLSRPLSGLKKY